MCHQKLLQKHAILFLYKCDSLLLYASEIFGWHKAADVQKIYNEIF